MNFFKLNNKHNIMRLIAIWIMKKMIKTQTHHAKFDNTIMKCAYGNMISNYKHIIIFLDSNRK